MAKTCMLWNVVYTEPQCEYVAAYWLQQIGVVTFIPEYKSSKRRGGQGARRLFPVFPSYVFVGQAPGEDRFKLIEETRGVLQLIKVRGTPLSVPGAVIDELREAVRKNRFVMDEKRGGVRYVQEGVTAADLAKFKLNDKVLVTDGPFASFVGQIVRMGGRNEISVLLNIFNKETLVRLEKGQLKPLDAGQTNHPVSRLAATSA